MPRADIHATSLRGNTLGPMLTGMLKGLFVGSVETFDAPDGRPLRSGIRKKPGIGYLLKSMASRETQARSVIIALATRPCTCSQRSTTRKWRLASVSCCPVRHLAKIILLADLYAPVLPTQAFDLRLN
jgi:hypothetical protein